MPRCSPSHLCPQQQARWWSIQLVYNKMVLLADPVGYGPEAEISTDANIAAYVERAHTQVDALTAAG